MDPATIRAAQGGNDAAQRAVLESVGPLLRGSDHHLSGHHPCNLISTSSWLAFAIKPDRGLQGEVVTHPTLRSWLEPD